MCASDGGVLTGGFNKKNLSLPPLQTECTTEGLWVTNHMYWFFSVCTIPIDSHSSPRPIVCPSLPCSVFGGGQPQTASPGPIGPLASDRVWLVGATSKRARTGGERLWYFLLSLSPVWCGVSGHSCTLLWVYPSLGSGYTHPSPSRLPRSVTAFTSHQCLGASVSSLITLEVTPSRRSLLLSCLGGTAFPTGKLMKTPGISVSK